MQTFLPYPSFEQSAKVLDRQRLGKQRVEVLQILRSLAGETRGWSNHPAVKMWRGHERVLIEYGLAICDEWIRRGYKDTCREKIGALLAKFPPCSAPTWLGNVEFHTAHQSNLLRKDEGYYRPIFGEALSAELEYVWPVE